MQQKAARQQSPLAVNSTNKVSARGPPQTHSIGPSAIFQQSLSVSQPDSQRPNTHQNRNKSDLPNSFAKQVEGSDVEPITRRQDQSEGGCGDDTGNLTKTVTILADDDYIINDGDQQPYVASNQAHNIHAPFKSQTAQGARPRRSKKARRSAQGSRQVVNQQMNATGGIMRASQGAGSQSQGRKTVGTVASQHRRKQIYALLQQVESLQTQIQKVPERKAHHFLDPYTKIGQASNLNLKPQKAQLARDIADKEEHLRKQEIQRQAQALLARLEADRKALQERKARTEAARREALEAGIVDCNCLTSVVGSPTGTLPGVQIADETDLVIVEGNARINKDVSSQECFMCTRHRQQQEANRQISPNSQEAARPKRHTSAKRPKSGTKSPHNQSSSHYCPVQCEQCGHVCVTATEQTSDIPQALNQVSFDLEDEEQRRLGMSPSALLGRGSSAAQLLQKSQSTEQAPTVIAEGEKHRIKSKSPCCKGASRVSGVGVQAKVVSNGLKCGNCGSRNVTRLQHGQSGPLMASHESIGNNEPKSKHKAMASDRYADLQLFDNKRHYSNLAIKDLGTHTKHWSMAGAPRTQQASTLNVMKVANPEGVVTSYQNDDDHLRSSQPLVGALIGDQIEAASVQYMASKQGGDLASHGEEEFAQINIQLHGNQLSRSKQGNKRKSSKKRGQAYDHSQSQPGGIADKGFEHEDGDRRRSRLQSGDNRKRSKVGDRQLSRSRSKSQTRNKSKKSIKMPDGNIMCGNCVAKHQWPKKRKRLSSAHPTVETVHQLTERDYCPVHGYRDVVGGGLHQYENEATGDDASSDVIDTRRVASADYQDVTIFMNTGNQGVAEDSEKGTENADLESKRIRDDIEYTSMTHSARPVSFNIGEMDDDEQEQLSEVLISELRAIASGNFVLGADPLVVSTQMSIDTQLKSNRINLLSLGAYTVPDDYRPDMDAQSNIATDEHPSIYQSSVMAVSEMGSKAVPSGPRAVANTRASGAYGSEIAYSNSQRRQAGGYPLNQMLVNEEDDEDDEEFEEETEEEFEEELTIEQQEERQKSLADFPQEEDKEDLNSHCTSYSSFYVIDEREEARLKQIAFEKYMAEKAIEQQMAKRQRAIAERRRKRKEERQARRDAGLPLSPQNESDIASTQQSHAEGVAQQETIQQAQLLEPGTSIELVDKSMQYSKDKGTAEQSLNRAPSSRQSDYQQSLQPQTQPDQHHQTYDTSEAEDAHSYQTGVCTQKAFRHQVLYEEAPEPVRDDFSVFTRQAEVQDSSVLEVVHNHQARKPMRQQPSDVHSSQKTLLPPLHSGMTGIKEQDEKQPIRVQFTQQMDSESISKGQALVGESQSQLEVDDDVEATKSLVQASISQKDPTDTQGNLASPSKYDLSEVPQTAQPVKPHTGLYSQSMNDEVAGVSEIESAQAQASQYHIMRRQSDQQPQVNHQLATVDAEKGTETVLEISATVDQPIDKSREGEAPLESDQSLQDDLGRDQDTPINDSRLLSQRSKLVEESAQPGALQQLTEHERSKILSRGTAATPDDLQPQRLNSMQESAFDKSMTVQDSRSRKSRRKRSYERPEMVDRSQQDSRCGGSHPQDPLPEAKEGQQNDMTFAPSKAQTILQSDHEPEVNQDYGTMTKPPTDRIAQSRPQTEHTASQRSKAKSSLDFEARASPTSRDYLASAGEDKEMAYASGGGDDKEPSVAKNGLSEPSRSEVGQEGRNQKSKYVSSMQTGDEQEPQMPFVSDQAISQAELQHPAAYIEATDAIETEVEPQQPFVADEPHIIQAPSPPGGFIQEDADAYVRRMMASHGFKKVDDTDSLEAAPGCQAIAQSEDSVPFTFKADQRDSSQAEKFRSNIATPPVGSVEQLSPDFYRKADLSKLEDESIQRQGSAIDTIQTENQAQFGILTMMDRGDAVYSAELNVGEHLTSKEPSNLPSQLSDEQVAIIDQNRLDLTTADLLPAKRIKKDSNQSSQIFPQVSSRNQDESAAAFKAQTQTQTQTQQDIMEPRFSMTATKTDQSGHQPSIPRSPKAYKIKSSSKTGRHGKSHGKRGSGGQDSSLNSQLQTTLHRRATPQEASFFGSKAKSNTAQKSLRKDTNQDLDQSQVNIKIKRTADQILIESPPPNKTRSSVASHYPSNSRQKCKIIKNQQFMASNIYESSPRVAPHMVLAQGPEPQATGAGPWNGTTDLSLRNFIQQRTAKRIKEIEQEVDQAKQPLFTKQKGSKTVVAENEYLKQGFASQGSFHSGSKTHTLNNQTSRSGQKIGRSRKDLASIADKDIHLQRLGSGGPMHNQNNSLLASSGANLLDLSAQGLAPHVPYTETKNSVTSLDRYNSQNNMQLAANSRVTCQPPQFWTLTQNQEPMSNFSAHYRQFKEGGNLHEQRRNITVSRQGALPSSQRKNLKSDIYFPGQVASDEETTVSVPEIEARRRKMATSLCRDGASLSMMDSERANQTVIDNYGVMTSKRQQHNTSSASSGMLVAALKQPLSNQIVAGSRYPNGGLNASPGTGAGVPHGLVSSTSVKKRLQFYPDVVSHSTAKKTRLASQAARGAASIMKQQQRHHNYSGSKHAGGSLGGGLNDFNLLHDSAHAPYFRAKHLKTTAYL